MGLYIPKMTIPKNCYACKIESYVPNCPVYMYYSATEYMEERHPDCPLVEVPETHGRLVDLDKMIEELWDGNSMEVGKFELRFIPTIIEAEGE